MPEKRINVAVNARTNSKYFYGFRSPNQSEAATLGLIVLTEGTSPAKDVAFSPKNQKPFAAYRPGVIAKGGLIDASKVAALETAGYQITKKKGQNFANGSKSVIVGVRLTADLVLAWRYPLSKWNLIPAAVKTAAGVALATTYPPLEIAYHADGFVLKTAITAIGILPGMYNPVSMFKQTFSQGSERYKIYSANLGVVVP